jgi:hypothetical protein
MERTLHVAPSPTTLRGPSELMAELGVHVRAEKKVTDTLCGRPGRKRSSGFTLT